MNRDSSYIRRRKGFTLLEVVLASTASALVLIAIYGVFFRAVKMRDDATERAREARLRARAISIIRDDLRSGFISGGFIAGTLLAGAENSRSNFPGSLRLTTAAAPRSVEELVGDVQEVEYYIVTDPDAVSRNAGVLVRAVDRDIMEPIRPEIVPERVLGNVASMEVSFFDGAAWLTTWEVTETDTTVPKAIRVRLVPGIPEGNQRVQAPIDIVVPWMTEPQTAPPAPEGDPV